MYSDAELSRAFNGMYRKVVNWTNKIDWNQIPQIRQSRENQKTQAKTAYMSPILKQLFVEACEEEGLNIDFDSVKGCYVIDGEEIGITVTNGETWIGSIKGNKFPKHLLIKLHGSEMAVVYFRGDIAKSKWYKGTSKNSNYSPLKLLKEDIYDAVRVIRGKVEIKGKYLDVIPV
jgi:hypothetical protein